MSGRKSKQLRRRAEDLLIEWLRTMVPDGEDTSKIHERILYEFLPEQTHIFANNSFFLVHIVYAGFTNKLNVIHS
jgi:hypothetical protein